MSQKSAKSAKSKRIHQMTIKQFEEMFPDHDACKAYLVRHRWPVGIRCPRCGNEVVYELPSRPFHWQCHQCAPQGYRFSVLVGTIFENTNIGLRDWFRVIHMMLTSKKGISALQIQRQMGFGSYKTAWYMCHRIRVALQDREFHKLMGIVEVDETYIGGKMSNKHKKDRFGVQGKSDNKTPVVGAVSRKGNIVARVIERADARTLRGFVNEVVSNKVSLLATDEHAAYRYLQTSYPHGMVDHGAGQYVHGNIHTNTIEGFWSILKRGIVGSYHKVSAKYLPLYVAEFCFRYNNRENADIFGTAISGC